MFKLKIFFIVLLGLVIQDFVQSAPAADLVDLSAVPGLDKFKNYTSKVFSGYLYINENKSHHYLFVESQNSPANDPLVIWLNGGPGCSSVLGFLYEHGPFIYEDGSTELIINEYAWNKRANVLYMESPACVGLSYCSDRSMPFDDESTAADNLAAFLSWTVKFPEHATHEVFIAGESYAGVYVPYLAYYMDQYNEKAQKNDYKINLVGYAVGNPVTLLQYDDFSDLSFWSTHAALSPAQVQDIKAHCSGNTFDENYCANLLNNLNTILEDVNIYDFYRYCFPNSTSSGSQYFQRFKGLYKKHYGYYAGYEPDPERPPCIDDVGAYLFLNNQTVRRGLHIWDNASVWENHTWYMCADINYTPGPNASYFIYPHMIQKGYRILVYSGDSDGSVPTIGTIQWIEKLKNDLNMKVIKPHSPWTLPGLHPDEPQVVGYYRKYDGLQFATVAGVGHMAPQWNKPASFKMFYSFLNNTDLN